MLMQTLNPIVLTPGSLLHFIDQANHKRLYKLQSFLGWVLDSRIDKAVCLEEALFLCGEQMHTWKWALVARRGTPPLGTGVRATQRGLA